MRRKLASERKSLEIRGEKVADTMSGL